ncbi:MAG: DUF3604 domain-containing protein, partial [Proteobacteria bacterium]|nr:DUF3604 domain-containing protein [Pseudomonadota bacterium]
MVRTLLMASAALLLGGSAAPRSAPETHAGRPLAARPPAQNVAPAARRAFFGELHLHTIMSLDAWTFGTKVTPDQAYRFARGETVMVPAEQVAKEQGLNVTGLVPARRAWPLDFTAVTDHSEYVGAMAQLDDPNSAFSASPTGKALRDAGFVKAEEAAHEHDTPATRDLKAAAEAAQGWAVEMKAANDN